MNEETARTVPGYATDAYPNYFSPFRSKICLHAAYAFASTFGFFPKLCRAVVDELPFGEKVLLLGVVGADF